MPAEVVPRVVAHRGASAEAPENTLAAVRRAIARDADLVEVDVQRTKDGALVVLHDTTLARTTDVRRLFPLRKPWLVGDFTLDEISRLDAGGWWSELFAGEGVPTLEQVVDVVRPSRAGLLVEVKATALHPGLAADVATTLRSVPGYLDEAVAAGRLIVQSFDHGAVRRHKQLEPGVPVGVLGTPTRAELGALATWADQVNPVHWSVRPAFVDAVHRHGLECQLWTVDRVAHMRRALDAGADGVITNHPDVLRRLVEDRRGDRAGRIHG
jgi:glycerophosphoryl diester phosphodiesterase